ncbi:hypothetical protein RCL1_008907 [Eukaryota sp. TZLM3-RCL]
MDMDMDSGQIRIQSASAPRKNFSENCPDNNPAKSFSGLLERIGRRKRTHSENVPKTDELHRYLSEETIALTEDPLKWWRHSGRHRFPALSRMAREYLCIQGTSVPCEQLFSLAGNTVTRCRTLLCDDFVEASLCFRSWQTSSLAALLK